MGTVLKTGQLWSVRIDEPQNERERRSLWYMLVLDLDQLQDRFNIIVFPAKTSGDSLAYGESYRSSTFSRHEIISQGGFNMHVYELISDV